MPDWLITNLGSIQGGIVRTLAAEMRAGGLGTAWLAFGLGALHALTPGHGKAALAAYFLGREARIGKGVRIALVAALLHVLSGFAAFLVLRFFVGQAHSITGRGSPTFTVLGHGLIIVAGAVMLFQSVRPASPGHDGAHALTGGIGIAAVPAHHLGPRLRLGSRDGRDGDGGPGGTRARDRDHDRDCRRGDDPRAPLNWSRLRAGCRSSSAHPVLQGIAGVGIIVIGLLTLAQVRL